MHLSPGGRSLLRIDRRLENAAGLFLSTLFLLLLFGHAHAQERVSVYVASPSWRDLTLELAHDFFSQYHIDLAVRPVLTPWKRAVQDMETGRLDMILTIYKTPARTQYMAFSIPFVEVPTAVIVPAGSSLKTTRIDDLLGLRGLKVRGASLGRTIDRHGHRLSIEDTTDEAMILRMLVKGHADYGVGAQYIFQTKVQEMGYTHQIRILSPPLSIRGLRFAFSRKSRFVKYLTPFNEYLRKRLQDASIQARIAHILMPLNVKRQPDQ